MFVIRLLNLIGNGVCKNFRDNPKVETFGEMELIFMEDAAKSVLDFALSNSKIRSIIYRDKIKAILTKIN